MKENNKSKIFKQGYSLGVRIPACVRKDMNLQENQDVKVENIGNQIVITIGETPRNNE